MCHVSHPKVTSLLPISQAKRLEIYTRPAFLKATKHRDDSGREIWTFSEPNEEGRVFMMGDSRDNSADSRVEGGIGQIPYSYIKGRASIIWISFGGSMGIRFERMFRSVH